MSEFPRLFVAMQLFPKSGRLFSGRFIVHIIGGISALPRGFPQCDSSSHFVCLAREFHRRNEEPDFPAEEWRECSEGSKKLVISMLQKNPENRISLEKVLEDSWTLHPPQRHVGVSERVRSSRFPR